MSAKYLLSYCVKPIYLQDTIDKAKSCGLITGILYASVITFLLTLYVSRLYILNTLPYPIQTIQLLGIFLIILWCFLPDYYTKGYGNIWKGYHQATQELLAQGYTQYQILGIFNNFFTTNDSNINIPGIPNLSTRSKVQKNNIKSKY